MKTMYIARQYATPPSASIQLDISRNGDQEFATVHAFVANPYLISGRTNDLHRGSVSRDTIVALRDTLNQVLEDWE